MMKSVLAAIAVTAALSQAASAATIVNGSFEDTIPGGDFVTLNNGSYALTGWTIGGHSVDFIGSYWQAAAGKNSLDMAGNGLGSVSQLISDLTAGVRYMVTFAMSGNPDGGLGPKSMLVNAGEDGTYEYTVTGLNSRGQMKWEYKQYFFTATGTEQLLTFTALTTPSTADVYGPGLDDISIIAAVPLPASAPLILAGLGALAALRRRRRA